MSYKDYQNARDAAWRLLLDCGVDRLPVDLNAIRRQMGVSLYSYERAAQWMRDNKLTGIARGTDGLTTYWKGEPVVLFDKSVTPQRARFTIAHELGHITLKHVKPGGVTLRNREPEPDDAPMEVAANQFAARLLAPACVLWALEACTPEEIARLCHISAKAAAFRAERMEELRRRGRFLTSPLEKEVYRRFLPYIRELRLPHPEDWNQD